MLHLSEEFDNTMVLESVDFLGILASCQSLAILDHHIDTTLVNEEFQVECSVALRDGSVV